MVLGLGVITLWIGRQSVDLVLTLVGCWTLLVMALLGIASFLYRILFARDLARAARESKDGLEGVERQLLITGLRIPRRRWPLASEPTWKLSTPPAQVECSETNRSRREGIRPKERGHDETITREVLIEDLFGLWSFRHSVSAPARIVILPATGHLDPAQIQACLASGDLLAHPLGKAEGDRVDYRTYNRSDPARMILWKVYARTRELLVRTQEPSRTPDARPLVYLVTGSRDDAAAGAARVLMESGILGDGARFAADGQPSPVEDAEAALEVIVRSRDHRHREGLDFAKALADPSVSSTDPVVLVCPAHAGLWAGRVLGPVAADPARFLILGAGDCAPPPRKHRGLKSLLWRDDELEAESSEDMQSALAPLVHAGARVVFLDRQSGALRVLGEGSRDELAGLGASA